MLAHIYNNCANQTNCIEFIVINKQVSYNSFNLLLNCINCISFKNYCPS